jgi:hypothetical protein
VRNPAVAHHKPSDAWRQGEASGFVSPPRSKAHPLRRSIGTIATGQRAWQQAVLKQAQPLLQWASCMMPLQTLKRLHSGGSDLQVLLLS